jgi:hypothetical protein
MVVIGFLPSLGRGYFDPFSQRRLVAVSHLYTYSFKIDRLEHADVFLYLRGLGECRWH